MENWKDIQGYDGDYQISNRGKIRSMKNSTIRILKTFLAGKGYEYVDLCKKSIYERFLVHRLVAIHFIDNKENLKEVNHKDGNKLNNTIDNLEWVSGVGNMKHAREKLGFNQNGENSVRHKISEENIRDAYSRYISGESSVMELSKEYGVHHGHLSSIFRGTFWKHLKLSDNALRAN